MNKIPQIDVLGMKIDIIQIPRVIETMEEWIKNRDFGNYICISNMNDIAYSYRNREIRKATNAASLSVPDGFSLVLLARMHGYPLKRRVYGSELMNEFLNLSEKKEYSHFFYGATNSTLEKLNLNLRKKFPGLKINGFYSPPFRELSEDEDREVIEMINLASPDVLWIGLGCPKQQLWMYRHKDKLKVPVMVGVGAAFDFLAGVKPQAPRWLRDNGFEWLFRLVTEPKRLWKRYLIGNTLFSWFLLREFINIKILKKNTPSF
ncbi:MAG: WecB/TagA/CpsF family glycosyltransferase [Candidatus Omnitrophica bacterium]|nr:WecB/TagA/CpsF family glycosyltransferase [Candidatus Omnitrophota bacterium]